MKLKKLAKTFKIEKLQHLNGCFKSTKHFLSNFQNFNFFSKFLERKMAQNIFFVIFGRQIPFLIMYNFMNFNEFVKKL